MPSSTPCLRCGYDLQGLPADGNCPECGMGVRRSLVPGDELRHAPPGWLGGLTAGAWLLLVSVSALTLLPFVMTSGVGILHKALLLALALAFTAGAWLLTRPQPRFDTTPPAHRWLVRTLAGLLLAQVVLLDLGNFAGSIPLLRAAWLLAFTFVAFPLLLMLHLRRLAQRVLDPRLAQHCAIIGYGASAALLLQSASLFTPDAWYRGPAGRWTLPATVVLAAAGLMFVIWSALTLLRFALAFARAWRASRDAWDAADASAVVPAAPPVRSAI